MVPVDSFVQDGHFFWSWFQSRKTTLNSKISLADRRQVGKGRAVVATQDLAQDEELFSVARSDILSLENSDFSSNPAGQNVIAQLDDQWLSLILVMMYEYLRGSNSPWKPYFDVLPFTFDTLMFWTEEELQHLQASAVTKKIGKDSADKMFHDKIIPAVRNCPDLFSQHHQTLSDNDILNLAHRMGSIIMAYAFDIEKSPSAQAQDEEGYVSDEEGDALPKGMVPMADMLNADADLNNARLFYEEDKVCMRTLIPVKAGEELFNDYGPLPRADLLRRYGYITSNYEKYDVVEISHDFAIEVFASLTPENRNQISKQGFLDKLNSDLDDRGFLEDSYDICISRETGEDEEEDEALGDPMFPAGLQMLLYRLIFQRKHSFNGDMKPAKRPDKISDGDQLDTFELYIQVLRQRLSQYATTLEQDRKAIAEYEASAQVLNRGYMATQVRAGEKKILSETIRHMTNNLAELQEKLAPQDEGRPSKRARY